MSYLDKSIYVVKFIYGLVPGITQALGGPSVGGS